jgi:large conductance mechanosensitive channel
MLKEFRDFIARGNAMDLAVGIIIGASFTAIVNSLVNDLINPVIGIFTGGIDFSNLFFALSTETFASVTAAEEAGVAVFKYGSFITAVINFLIIAWVVFLLVRGINKLKAAASKPAPAAEPEPEAPKGPTQEELLIEIRDALRARNGAPGATG